METGLVVADLEGMVGFYESAFGLSRVRTITVDQPVLEGAGLGAPCTIAILRAPDGAVLKLLASRGERTAERPLPVIAVSGRVLLTFHVGDLDGVVARVLDLGGSHLGTGEPATTLSGGRMTFLADPEGNAVELIEPAAPATN